MSPPPESLFFDSFIAPLVLSRLQALGLPTESLADTYGLQPGASTQSSIRLSISAFQELCDSAARLSEDPFFGLNLALWLPRGSYGLIEYAARTAASLREAISASVRLVNVPGEVVHYSFVEAEGAGVFTQTVQGASGALGRHANEFIVAYRVRIGRELSGDDQLAPSRVWFAHPRPEDMRPLFEHFRTEDISFDGTSNGLVYPSNVLDTPVRSADKPLHELLVRQLQVEPLPTESSEPFEETVRKLVMELFETWGATQSLERVALRLRMSSRTIQRRLAEKQINFKDIVEDVRRTLALGYLQQGKLTVDEVAHRLGYSSGRVFSRAFKRWTGQTPSKYE